MLKLDNQRMPIEELSTYDIHWCLHMLKIGDFMNSGNLDPQTVVEKLKVELTKRGETV